MATFDAVDVIITDKQTYLLLKQCDSKKSYYLNRVRHNIVKTIHDADEMYSFTRCRITDLIRH